MSGALPILLAAASGGVFTDLSGRATIRTDTPRAVGAIVWDLRQRYGWRINYEDPRIRYRGDYVDVTVPSYQPRTPEDRALDPRAGLLEVTFAAPSEEGAPDDPAPVLEALVQAHAASGLPGRFEVRQLGDQYDIVGVAADDESGQTVSQDPVLDARISIPERERSLMDLVHEVCVQVSRATGVRIQEGTLPAGALRQGSMQQGFSDRPAREVLREALSRLRWPWAWSLNCEIGGRTCVLNVDPVGVLMQMPWLGCARAPAQTASVLDPGNDEGSQASTARLPSSRREILSGDQNGR